MSKKNPQFDKYKEMLSIQETFVQKNVTDHKFNLRLPSKLNEMLDQEVELLRKELGLRMSKNDFVIFALMILFNYSQSIDEPKNFYRKQNKSSLEHFLSEEKNEILKRLSFLHIQKEILIATKKGMNYKDRAKEYKKLAKRSQRP